MERAAADPQYVDPTGRYVRLDVVGTEDYGLPGSLAFVERRLCKPLRRIGVRQRGQHEHDRREHGVSTSIEIQSGRTRYAAIVSPTVIRPPARRD